MKEISDELELIKLAKNGDEKAMHILLEKYKYLAITIARKYYLIGGEKDDLIQEGMIGLFKSILTYDITKPAGFKGYSSRLVEREIISAIRRDNTQNSSILNESVYGEENETMVDESYPEQDVISEESYKELSEEIYAELSLFEQNVVRLYLSGYNYIDIAKMLGKSNKAIDNALTRIKNKLKFLKERL